ncbi:MAG TPA: 30S ribosome-binding factor RbfA [Flavobacteriaceae bacterium]|nr:30S ribosome-binding factor RbfA [Flavobacteriaceae bacterium]
METNRQKKIAGVIQKDLAEILQHAARDGMKGVIISVTKVHVTTDLSQAKVYVSVFPQLKREIIVEGINANRSSIRYELAQRTKHQLRRMPDLHFYIDDSLDYIEGIDNALKGKKENPIENPDILDKRKKI